MLGSVKLNEGDEEGSDEVDEDDDEDEVEEDEDVDENDGGGTSRD